jgi:ribosomal protein S18 acetylase RimI-like enzyme
MALHNYRAAVPADLSAIRDLVGSAYGRWVPVIGREPLPMLADYEAALQHHDFDLLFDGDTLIGLIETALHPDHLWIENVAVDPSRQGQGWGSHLLQRAETRARAAGRTELRLLTNAAFDSNVALYQKLGYRITRREPFMGGITLYLGKAL